MGELKTQSVIDRLKITATKNVKRIVFPECDDPRVVTAAVQLAKSNLVVPVFVDYQGSDLGIQIESIKAADKDYLERCSRKLFNNRRHKGMSIDDAKVAITDDRLLFASTLVAIGAVDGCVAGSVATTADVIRSALYGLGLKADCRVVSSYFLMELNDRCFTYADCGVVPDPDVEQLAEIAVSSAASHQQLTGERPAVAMLSFSTKGSANHQRVEKVRAATKKAKEINPDLDIDGELQFDAAWLPEIGNKKAPDSPVAGRANVFVFPDLDSGNIAYKITERLAGATALGPLIQGLAKPCMDLSRGCSVQDIADVAVIASVLAEQF